MGLMEYNELNGHRDRYESQGVSSENSFGLSLN